MKDLSVLHHQVLRAVVSVKPNLCLSLISGQLHDAVQAGIQRLDLLVLLVHQKLGHGVPHLLDVSWRRTLAERDSWVQFGRNVAKCTPHTVTHAASMP